MQPIDRSLVALKRLTESVSSTASLDDVLNVVYEEFQSLIPFKRIGYAEVDPSGECLVARWARSDREIRLNAGFSAPLSGSSLEPLLKSQKPRVLNDLRDYLEKHPRSSSTRCIVAEGFRSSLTCPLVVEGQAVGFIFFTSDVPNQYSCEHTAVFEQIAGELALQILLTQERARSRKTLSATVVLMIDILEMTNPIACGQATRARSIVHKLTGALGMKNAWEVEMAALLCRLGCVTVPNELIEKQLRQDHLTTPEEEMLESLAEVAYELLAKIPHLEGVAEIVRWQEDRYDTSLALNEPRRYGASLLKAALDFDRSRREGMTTHGALSELRRHETQYAPGIVALFDSALVPQENKVICRNVNVNEITTNMRFAQHVVTMTGKRLIGAGNVVTDALVRRLRNYAKTETICEPIAVEILPWNADRRQYLDQCIDNENSLDLIS